ncbi:MAG: hypothetical protein AB8C46_00855 [Burkholderiaceae bacterium]
MKTSAGNICAHARWLLLGVALLLGACSSLPDWVPKPGGSTGAGKAPDRAPGGRSGQKGSSVDLGKARRGVARGSSGAISINGQCKQTERDGYAEDAIVKVARGTVTELKWKITVPKRGTCRFNASQFKQTKTSPTVELLARNGSGCKLLMWSDARRITLAHAGCAKFCTRGVYDKAWPVMFNPKSGRCADIRR